MSRIDTTTVIAVTSEEDRFRGARIRGQEVAAEMGATLLLYDWDAPTWFGDPLPTWWSSEGTQDRFGDRLDAEQLDEVGRAPIADQVREAERGGVTARAWLPSDHGPAALAEYARTQRAGVIVVPVGLLEVAGLEALLSRTDRPAAEVAAETAARVVTA